VSRYPTLGFDPAPGDVGEAHRLDRALQGVLTTLSSCERTLGQAADAFAAELRELLPHLRRAGDGHREAQRALRRWADVLGGLQSSARSLEGRAADAAHEVQLAVAALRRAQARTVDATDPAQVSAAATAVAQAQAAVRRAEASLDAARSAARQLADEHRAASDAAPVEPGVLQRIGSVVSGVVDAVRSFPDAAWSFLQDNANALAEVGDVLAELAAVVGVVAIFAPAPFAAIALGLAGLALGAHALADAAGADIPASTYVFDVVGVVAAGAGAVGAAGYRGASAAVEQGASMGWGGMVASGRSAQAYYSNVENLGTLTGLTSTATSSGLGAVTARGDDRPFAHLVPDSRSEAVAFGLTGPAGAAFVSAVRHGLERDRAAADAAAADRWLR
jgi:hypothetical protein